MTLLDEIRLRTAHVTQSELLQLMGYASVSEKTLSQLQRVLDDPHLGLGQAYFDFKFNSEGFLRKLCQVLGLGHIDVDHTIDAIKRELQEDQRAFKPYLFVDTEFRRQGQSIAILALCEWMRRLDFPQQFWRKTLVDQVEAARQRVREHMKSTLGELGVWGSIKRYRFYYTEEDCVILSTTGDIVADSKLPPAARATLVPGVDRVLRLDGEDDTPEG